ncbi:uncharacterized protein [Typha latifolia]|uniref:uncharacterized protein isoform X2 n=1 Tax=Typha latifolia TaxID=4733 RepID=UPI003C2CAE31
MVDKDGSAGRGLANMVDNDGSAGHELANMVDNDGSAGRELANMVDNDGISPLYLAAMIGSLPLLQVILPSSSTETASYAGPRGQTALHAAALCQNSASAGNAKIVELLLLKDISLAYMADSSGLFPVHVASIKGEVSVIKKLINQCPDSDELLDSTGKNLLHTAVEHKNGAIVQHVCKRSEFVKLMNARDHEGWLVELMNARDHEGNTPLHLAVRTGDEFIVSLLVQNKRVNSSIMNKRGLTPLDLSFIEFEESGLSYFMKPSYWILWCLAWLGAIESPGGMDHFLREKITPVDLKKESEKLAQLNRGLAIVSVVIATVTFAAAFTLPGGFKADGTPTLANRYMFKAFVIADTFAFIFSTYSTYLTTFGGSNLVPLKLQHLYFVYSSVLLLMASKSLVAALAFGIYLVLAPVSHFTGIFVCVITSTSILFLGTPDTIRLLNLAKTMTRRLGWKGLFKTCVPKYVKNWWKSNYLEVIFQTTLGGSLIYLFIFLLALPGKNKIMG